MVRGPMGSLTGAEAQIFDELWEDYYPLSWQHVRLVIDMSLTILNSISYFPLQ